MREPVWRLARIALIVNPRAGADDTEIGELVEALGGDVEVTPVDALGDGTGAGAERLVVAGGDGSIAPAAAAAARRGIPLGVVPAGTANDFARAMELPLDDPLAAARLAGAGRDRRRVDLARFGELPFLNVANAGLAVEAAEQAADLKEPLGAAAYTVAAARAGLTGDPVRVTVAIDGAGLFSGEAWQVVVANTGRFGGGASVPADPADGALDVVVIPADSRVALVRRAVGLRTGGILEQEGIEYGRGARVAVRGADAFNVDGEVRSGRGRTECSIDGAVDVVVG